MSVWVRAFVFLVSMTLGVVCAQPAGAAAVRDRQAGRSTSAIDTSDRAAVASAYAARLAPQLGVGSGLVTTPGCPAAVPWLGQQVATEQAVNFVRALSGLDPIRVTSALSVRAQAAALLMAANGPALEHEPPPTWTCWSPAGAEAAAGSALSMSYGEMTVGEALTQYLGDWGDTNTAVGHRRWLLDPAAVKVGAGMTPTTQAYYVLGTRSTTRATPAWTQWPSAGWFPAPLEPQGRWSLSSGDPRADFSRARVRVTGPGGPLPVTTYPVETDPGLRTLVWQVAGVVPDGSYRVRVTGIRHAAATRVTYRVRLFTP